MTNERINPIRLANHDTLVNSVWRKVESGKMEYHSHPLTESQRLENKFYTVLNIGKKLNTPANGLLGYHALRRDTGKDREQVARDNLISVINEGLVRPATGYTGDTNIHIDVEGNLIDGNEIQAFCAPLKLGGYFDSAGNFGPYWVIFHPEARGSDRYNGIPSNLHKYYLVPDEIDRQYIESGIENPISHAPIITYEDFIQLNSHELHEDWLGEDRKNDLIYAEAKQLLEQAKTLHNWEAAVDLYLIKINDSQLDADYRAYLVHKMRHISGYPVMKTDTEKVLRKAKTTLLALAIDSHVPENIRRQCLQTYQYDRNLLDRNDIRQLKYLAQDTSQPGTIRHKAINVLGGLTRDKVPETLAIIARDDKSTIGVRHQALFEMQSTKSDYIVKCTPLSRPVIGDFKVTFSPPFPIAC